MKILMIATGGTIASKDSGSGLTPGIMAEQLLAGITVEAEVHAVQPFSLDSTYMTPEHWVQLAVLIRDSWADFDGFVITHGTDTMAYGAAALSCLIQNADKPVIFTGSQLPMDARGSDAPANLKDAFRCAQQGSGGVWVCFNGRVIDGRSARKVHTRDFDAFRGFTDDDEMTVNEFCSEIAGEPQGGTVFYNRLDPKAAILKLSPGISAEIVHDFGTHVNALIIEGFGLGGIPGDGMAQVLAELISYGVRVIMTTQVFQGGCDLSVYEVGRKAEMPGLVQAKGMTTEYAVMRAMWALAYSFTADDFRMLFLDERD